MRVLGLDIGSRRTGVAVSDPARTTATPVSVLDTANLLEDSRILRRLVDDYEADQIVVGLPLSLDGTEGPQARDVRETASRITEHLGLPVAYHDERLSSAEAARVLRAGGLSAREQRGKVDKIAAALMLQSWLDARRGGSNDTGRSDG